MLSRPIPDLELRLGWLGPRKHGTQFRLTKRPICFLFMKKR